MKRNYKDGALAMLKYVIRCVLFLIGPILIFAWLRVAGTYSPARDVFAFGLTVSIVLVLRNRFAHRYSSDSAKIGSRVTPALVFGCCLAFWLTSGMFDLILAPKPLPLRGGIAAPEGMPLDRSKLRIGLGLSGGGYRAALVHAGVMEELSTRGIPVTNISSVSGGSIVGSFVASGGNPSDFVSAVKGGRFRFFRELLAAYNLPRWLSPVGNFTRRDVQAGIVRRVLLGNQTSEELKRPLIVLAATDLSHAMSLGMTEDGYLLVGPTTSRYFKLNDGMVVEGLGDLADKVAISGAFPGAFSALQTTARYTQSELPLSSSRNIQTISLALVDGGVRDNLGFNLLKTLDKEARGTGNNSLPWPVFKPKYDWALDLIILSDGGQSLDMASTPMSLLSQVMRAVDISGLSTGILRPIENSSELPVVPLSISSQFALTPDAKIVDLPGKNALVARRNFFRPKHFSESDLDRIANLVPAPTDAKAVLARYRHTRTAILNLTDLDSRCSKGNPSVGSLPECHWREFVDAVLDDIDFVTNTFRRSATLEDQYRASDADALVRLGRYFVLFRGREIDDAVHQAVMRRAE